MFKVRIKTSPDGGTHKATGEQDGYGLVRNTSAIQTNPKSTPVNNKMGAIPRDQANIEVEGGESVIGDVNKDGTMELMHFVGKRHSEGGVPVNIPEGSFIFSDTKSLTIKDREVIEKIFNLPFRKQGYTPGEISKKYEINTYVEILKDESADPLAKRSAGEMLKKNKQKLGILAFIQESMKGFPDGIPAIAEDVLSTMGIDPNQMAQQFAPQQPQQGMGAMPPQMEEQGIPMSEDEDAMAGMMPEGPMVAPDDIAQQMTGKFGGSMPEYQKAGTVTPSCPFGYKWNPHVKACVTIPYANVAVKGMIPMIAYQNYFNLAPTKQTPKKPAPKKQDDWSIEDVKERMIEGSKKKTPPPSLTTSGKKPSQEPLGDNSAAAQFKRNNTPAEIKQKEALRNYYDEQTKKTLAEGKKKEAEALAKNPYKNDVPGFGKKSDLDEYMKSGAEQWAAGNTFYEALASQDPAKMIDAAKTIKDTDVPYSVGWLPFTDQDKIDDMVAILYQEAYKYLNKAEKDKLQKYYSTDALTKNVDKLISDAELKAKNATDYKQKIQYANEVAKYKRYKDYLENDRHKEFRDQINKSKVTYTDPLFFTEGDYGSPIQDMELVPTQAGTEGSGPYNILWNDTELLGINLPFDDMAEGTDQWFRGPRSKTYLEIYEEITKAADKINKTNIATIAPLGNKGLLHTKERAGWMNWDAPELEDNVKYIYNRATQYDNKPNKAKDYKPEYKIPAAPRSIFRISTNADGEPQWVEYTEDGAQMAVSNPEWVKALNANAQMKEPDKGPFLIKPADDVSGGSIIEYLEQENKLNPQSQQPANTAPSGNQGQPQQRRSVVAPIVPKKEAPKFDNGLSENDFKLEKGGVVGENMTINGQVFRYGGLIDEGGKLRYNRGGSVLPQYNKAGTVTGPGDPPKEEFVEEVTTGSGIKAKKYKQVFTDPNGGPPTTIVILRDAADETKILGRMNSETRESYKDPNQVITRASSTWITPDNLNDWEITEVNKKWKGNKQAYADFMNANNQIRLNTEFREAIVKQYQEDTKDKKRQMYTGQKQSFYDLYHKDVENLAQNPDEIINTMMKFEENNARLAVYGYGDRTSGKGPWADPNFVAGQNVVGSSDVGAYVNAEARKIINDNKDALGDLDFSKNYLGQGTYISYRRALMNNAQFQDLAEHKQTGEDDETTFGIKGKVSGIDNYSTNTTLEERLGYKPKPPQPPKKDPKKKQAFYCVEYSDGTKAVETVEYDEDKQPTQPSGEFNGKTVKSATLYQTLDEANKNCDVPKTPPPPDIPPPSTPPQQGPWFTPDVINLATGIRQRVPHPSVTLRQMPQIYSGYDLNNPITQIAGATGLMRQQQDLAMNTMDATTGFAAMAGQGYDALAKGISDVEEKNVDTVNNYLGRIGSLQYQYDLANLGQKRQFDVDTAVATDEWAADLNKRDAQNAMLYNTGWGNVFKDEGFKLAYPQAYHANRITPDYSWSGRGRNIMGPDTHVSPGGSTTAQTDCSKVYAEAYNQVKGDATRDEAAKKEYASRMEAACVSQNNARANSQTKTQQQSYVANANALFGSEFGGTFYTAPGSYEFGGTYFDDF
jgi:hypothetical protein